MSTFLSPKTLGALAPLLKDAPPQTYLLAGGTDLMVYFKKHRLFDYSIIDLSNIQEIQEIQDQGGSISIGAGVTMTALEHHPLIKEFFPDLSRAASMVGSPLIRNRATIGGNVCNASHCADITPVLFCRDAMAVLMDASGQSLRVSMADLLIGSGKTTLGPNRVLTHLELNKSPEACGFAKLGTRKAVTISKLNCAARATLEEDRLAEIAIFLGAVGIRPVKAQILEKALLGQPPDRLEEEPLVQACQEQIEALIPQRSSKHYKKIALMGLLEDVLQQIRRQR